MKRNETQIKIPNWAKDLTEPINRTPKELEHLKHLEEQYKNAKLEK